MNAIRFIVGVLTLALMIPQMSSAHILRSNPRPMVPLKDSFSISLVSAREDKAGMKGVFAPGKNSRGVAYDWKWNLNLNLASKKSVTFMNVVHNYGNQGWSTAIRELYPLVVFKDGSQINSTYSMSLTNPFLGTSTFSLYGQSESPFFAGGTLIIGFSDGSLQSIPIPASNIIIGS